MLSGNSQCGFWKRAAACSRTALLKSPGSGPEMCSSSVSLEFLNLVKTVAHENLPLQSIQPPKSEKKLFSPTHRETVQTVNAPLGLETTSSSQEGTILLFA